MHTLKQRPITTTHFCGLIVVLFLSIICSSQAMANSLMSIVDRTNIEADESITLKVIYDSTQTKGQPDFSALNQNFDIASNNVSSQKSIMNGTVTSSTEWRMVLFPKRAGQLLIPPFSFQGVRTNPITISVSNSQTNTARGNKPDIFLETDIDKSDIYVQEQAIVTFRLFFSRSVRSLEQEDIDIPNLQIEELPRADFQKTIGQKTYGVAEFRYALTADASGEIVIPSKTWTVESTDQASNRFGFNGGRRKLSRVKTEAIKLQVKPKPDTYPLDKTWLPASHLSIAQAWSKSLETFKVGEPITRTITVMAKGVSAEQLPPIFPEQSLDGFKFYPDKPSQDNHTTGEGLAGTRTESVAIVPTKSGDLTLPEISVTWWDSNSQSIQKATLPAININVAASEAATDSSQTTLQNNLMPQATETIIVEKTPVLWIILACLSLIVNLVLGVFIWFTLNNKEKQRGSLSQKNSLGTQNIAQAFSQISNACRKKDPVQLRIALLTWSALKWPQLQLVRLEDINKVLQDEQLRNQLTLLNQALFSEQGGSVDYPAILDLLKKLANTAGQPGHPTALKPLYGQSSE